MSWNRQEHELAIEFLGLIGRPLGAAEGSEANPFYRRVMIDRHLKGLGENRVVIGKGAALKKLNLAKALAHARTERVLLIVLALDEESLTSATEFQQRERDKLVVLGLAHLESLVCHPEPQNAFVKIVREQVSLLALVPFETSSPATGPCFTGRTRELYKIQSSQDFALCGVGGIGKTSLLRQCIWLRRLQNFDDYQRTIWVDLMGTSEPNIAARSIVGEIGKQVSARTALSEGVTLQNFSETVRSVHREYCRREGTKRPFFLVLDEVGSLLQVDRSRTLADYFGSSTTAYGDNTKFPFMCQLRTLCSHKVLRLTLCARTETRDLLNDLDNPFLVADGYSRLRLLDMKKLSDLEAKTMLVNPLRDLGIDLRANSRAIMAALDKAGGVPFRIAHHGLDIALEAGLPTPN